MPRRARPREVIAGHREAMAIAATLGGVTRGARVAKRWSLADLARRAGISVARSSEIERGLGARAPLETWVALGIALERPLAITFTRPVGEPISSPSDAGHLEIQEHLLQLARTSGRQGSFEVPTKPTDPARSTDVGIRDEPTRTRILAECWNTFGDLGAAVRATHRKTGRGRLGVAGRPDRHRLGRTRHGLESRRPRALPEHHRCRLPGVQPRLCSGLD
jgi:transcriptional regulator with XRE-family HTH domain